MLPGMCYVRLLFKNVTLPSAIQHFVQKMIHRPLNERAFLFLKWLIAVKQYICLFTVSMFEKIPRSCKYFYYTMHTVEYIFCTTRNIKWSQYCKCSVLPRLRLNKICGTVLNLLSLKKLKCSNKSKGVVGYRSVLLLEPQHWWKLKTSV